MLLNNKKFLDLTHIIFTLSLFLVSRNLPDLNIFFWIILYVFALALYVKDFKINFIILFLLLCTSLYIQLYFFEFILAKEFFVKVIGILLIFRFLNIKTKNHLFSFNVICLFISVLNLTESQDLINSLLSTVLLILTISNFYLSNQTTLIEMDLKNMIKYLGFGLGLIPVIAIFYLIIPRTDITLNLFNASKNNLGIPDSINLGSFEQISESDEKLFVLVNNNYKKNELYFRVKVFDQIDDKKSWRPSSGYFLIRKFPNSIQTVNFTPQNKMYDLIIENYKNSWLPVLKNTTIISDTQDYSFSIFNQTYRSKKKIESKKLIQLRKYAINMELNDELRQYYLNLPNSISSELKEWADTNKKGKTDNEYLKYILNTFNKDNFYYSLKPPVSENINDYSDFFFKIKEGYCEHYAGTFVILARLAGIPARIVTGYLGGELNNVGDFYEFKQQDAHAWVEIWDGSEWIEYDPTLAVPPNKVKTTLNQILNENSNENIKIGTTLFKNFTNYISYLDFVWTKSLISYDKNKQKQFIQDLKSLKISKNIILIFIPISLFLIIFFILKLTPKNIYKIRFFFVLLLSKKKNKILNSDTLDEIFKKLKPESQFKYLEFFKKYEKILYS
jgi:hypothetical protein